MEVIERITEVENLSDMGYIISTNKKEYKVLISSDQNCCEDAGHLSSNDNLNEFIGAQLMQVNLVDDNKCIIEGISNRDYDNGGIMFVNFETNIGTFQLAVYNIQNGYYSHAVSITTTDSYIEDYL